MGKSYRQFCGLARALDIIGDRWNLLIVRQLLVGPARYGELQAGLPGVATNLLADRLRDLESAGVLTRGLPDGDEPAKYALTPWGHELREPIDGLIRWSTPLMAVGPGADVFRIEWIGVALGALLRGRSLDSTVGIVIDGETVQVGAGPEGIEVHRPDGRPLDAIVVADAWTVLGLAVGALGLDAASVEVEGDAQAVRALFESTT